MTTTSTARRGDSNGGTPHRSGLNPIALARQAGAGLRLLLVMTVLLGVVYPLGIWAVSRLPGLNANAEGSLIEGPVGPTGSSLIGIDPVPADPAADPWFHTRPSAGAPDEATAGLGPADAATSGGSNLGADATDLVDAIGERRTIIAGREGVAPEAVPADAVTASFSGLDPHISPAYAALQTARVARVTGLGQEQVATLVAGAADGRQLGFLGEPVVNVPELNAALRAAAPAAR